MVVVVVIILVVVVVGEVVVVVVVGAVAVIVVVIVVVVVYQFRNNAFPIRRAPNHLWKDGFRKILALHILTLSHGNTLCDTDSKNGSPAESRSAVFRTVYASCETALLSSEGKEKYAGSVLVLPLGMAVVFSARRSNSCAKRLRCSQGLGPNDNVRAATQRLTGIPRLSLSRSHYTDTDPTSRGPDCARLRLEPTTSGPRSEASTN
ncbi:hypothetical protein ElyMa_001306500 [Elysia marginata]|uniref:Uncharacterized protein n=1 Tax=Elysia marginata TaxID=1093978 RepID=A0AAV4IHL2_9GAST|nr:hypothetical protein ElyMa_001306500 [Elysia marginata]